MATGFRSFSIATQNIRSQSLPILILASFRHLIGTGSHVRDLLELVVNGRLVVDDVGQLGHRQRVGFEVGILKRRVAVRSFGHAGRVALAPHAVVHGHIVQAVSVETDRPAALSVRDLILSLAEHDLQRRIVHLDQRKRAPVCPGGRRG